MKLSILIPTFRRPEAIDECLRWLAEQRCADDFEIIVGLDGPVPDTPDPEVPVPIRPRTRIIRYPRGGLIGIRRRMLEDAAGEIILWLNDDAYAHPRLLEHHLRAHKASEAPRMVAGRADWKPIDQPDLFDELVQKSDLIFFQQASGDEPTRTTYRNCFGINMSFPRDMAIRAGGIPEPGEHYGYEDIELAHRLARHGAQLWTAPGAVVTHDHRYRPDDVLRREYLLGRAAWDWAGINPSFGRDLFGRDMREDAELDYSREVLRRERRDAQRIERSFLALTDQPPGAVDASLLPVLAEHWVLLKRYLWRWGLLDASRGISPRWSLLTELQETLLD